ncbi:chromosomal replication initiator DnaA [Paracoccus jeotgali]|uniref:chromosomal replication initiator DnaA n=1 Tax=Paracoccus jeotgali TaxID=2065379 RepID=UPI0028A82FE4|nr:chromosomal replication initiator DnaA [Paracoccus jeotgali]
MARQLTLDLGHTPALGRSDFLVTPANALAMTTLDRPETWPQGRMLLIGPEGAGKTHLATIWSAETGAARMPARALRPDLVDYLAAEDGAVVIEDANRIGASAGAEQALFHLWNLCAARGCWLLLTARSAPREWDMVLPDLRSRMAAMPQTRIEAPDESLLAAVLVKLMADRQLVTPPGLIEWLVPRMDRDLGLARRLVDALDRQTMAERRGLTRSLAADILATLTEAEGVNAPDQGAEPEVATEAEPRADLSGGPDSQADGEGVTSPKPTSADALPTADQDGTDAPTDPNPSDPPPDSDPQG